MARKKSGEDGQEYMAMKYKLKPIVNELLKKGGWTSYKSIVEEYESRYPEEAAKSKLYALHKKPCYKALQAVISEINGDLKKKGYENGFEREGETRSRQFKLPEGIDNIDEDIVEDEKKYKKFRQKQLLRLIETSVGLFPGSWMAEFSSEIHKMMLGQEKTHRKIISFDTNERLTRLDLIPVFYDAIENRMVLKITYDARYAYRQEAIFHPHYIKEYNNRFFVFGKAIIDKEEKDGRKVQEERPVCNFALDRIYSVEVLKDLEYEDPAKDFNYEEYFAPIIGVTRTRKKGKDGTFIDYEKRSITIQTLDLYTHQRLMTKPLHPTQKQIKEFGSENQNFGLIKLNVIPNMELHGRLLEYGSHIHVLPTKEAMSFYKSFSNEVARLALLYQDTPTVKKEISE